MRAAGVLLSRTMRHSYSAKLPELLEARPRTRFNDQFRVALRTARLRNVGGTERPIAEQFKFIDERLKNLHHWLCTFWQVAMCASFGCIKYAAPNDAGSHRPGYGVGVASKQGALHGATAGV